MSDDHHQPIDNQSQESSFYNQRKSQQSAGGQQKKEFQKIPSKSDLYKSKHKKIRKRERGHKKPKSTKQEQRQRKILEHATQQAESIIQEMEKRYDEDRKLYQNKKPANKKLLYLKVLAQKLKNQNIWGKFLEMNGLQQFQLWFTKLPQGVQPSLTLRKGLLQILESLKVKSEQISKTFEIQRIVQKHKKSQTKQLRDLSESILLKWSKTLHDQDNE